MFELKAISQGAIQKALEKAERYRLLNEPEEAESICLDVLQVDPENQQALITLLLALTDQFEMRLSASRPQELLPRLHGEYERAYYAGIICERRIRALLNQGSPGARYAAYDGLREAMEWYEKAEAIRSPGNDDAMLRWNACARLIMQHQLVAAQEERTQFMLE